MASVSPHTLIDPDGQSVLDLQLQRSNTDCYEGGCEEPVIEGRRFNTNSLTRTVGANKEMNKKDVIVVMALLGEIRSVPTIVIMPIPSAHDRGCRRVLGRTITRMLSTAVKPAGMIRRVGGTFSMCGTTRSNAARSSSST